MSSLIFMTDENHAIVATDTLATTSTGIPFKFTTKAFPIPHLRMVMAATGVGAFLGKWFIRVNDDFLVRGVEHLNQFASETLLTLWHELGTQAKIPVNSTVTVYHFGVSELTGQICTYVFRSTSDFRVETLGYGYALKPDGPTDMKFESIDDIVQTMISQREMQRSKPLDEQVFIGGEVQILELNKRGVSILTAHRFDDYAHSEELMYKGFNAR